MANTLGVFRDDFYNAAGVLPVAVLNTSTQNGGTISAANLVGGQDTYLQFSGQTGAQSLTTDTAANIVAALQSIVATQLKTQIQAGSAFPPSGVPNLTNLSYLLTITNLNTSSGAITLTGGTGVTISGTNTIPVTTTGNSAEFLMTINSPTSITMTRVSTKGQ